MDLELKEYSRSFSPIRLPKIRKINGKTYRAIKRELRKHKDKCTIFDWVILEDIISKGNFSETAKVCLTEKCKDKFIIKLTKLTKENQKVVNNEITALKTLKNSQYIVNMYDNFECINDGKRTSVIIQELLGEDIHEIIKKNKNLPDSFYISVFKQTIRCIDILEKRRINHNDIHFGNLLMTLDSTLKNVKIKLIDFGGATGDKRYKLRGGVKTINRRKSKNGFVKGLDIHLFCSFIIRYDDMSNTHIIPDDLYELCSVILERKEYISASKLLKILES